MTEKPRHRFKVILSVLLLLRISTASVAAQSGGGYDLSWSTVDGGGGASSGGGFRLRSTAGQPDAGEMDGGSYRVDGGFWGGGAVTYHLYIPLVLKNVS
jgi:hypothetical protein